jgi:hypothetical protein
MGARTQFICSRSRVNNPEMREIMRTPTYLSANELKLRMRMAPGFLGLQKLLVIYTSLVDPRSPHEIARHTGLSESTVNRIIEDYNENGAESLEVPKPSYHGRKPWVYGVHSRCPLR